MASVTNQDFRVDPGKGRESEYHEVIGTSRQGNIWQRQDWERRMRGQEREMENKDGKKIIKQEVSSVMMENTIGTQDIHMKP